MNREQGFAIWITGLPSSGKSSTARELIVKLKAEGCPAVVLESDALRALLTPDPSYASADRDRFYELLARIGLLLTQQGVNVIFDATANLRRYRDRARELIPRFIEAYVDCTLDLCMGRDPKGIYRRAREGKAAYVPGLQAPYEPPFHADVTLDCRNAPALNAELLVARLHALGCL